MRRKWRAVQREGSTQNPRITDVVVLIDSARRFSVRAVDLLVRYVRNLQPVAKASTGAGQAGRRQRSLQRPAIRNLHLEINCLIRLRVLLYVCILLRSHTLYRRTLRTLRGGLRSLLCGHAILVEYMESGHLKLQVAIRQLRTRIVGIRRRNGTDRDPGSGNAGGIHRENGLVPRVRRRRVELRGSIRNRNDWHKRLRRVQHRRQKSRVRTVVGGNISDASVAAYREDHGPCDLLRVQQRLAVLGVDSQLVVIGETGILFVPLEDGIIIEQRDGVRTT